MANSAGALPTAQPAPSASLLASFTKNKKTIGVVLSIVIGLFLWLAPMPGDLSPAGQKALAMTIFAVIWWIFGVTHPAYTTFLLFLGYILAGLAPPAVVFALWTSPLMYLMIGAFLIAAAVTKSGLARRVAYFFMIRYANSYRSIVVLAYVLGFVLSFLIPHPFPRTLLIMALVAAIIKQANANKRDAAALGFAVFTSATATSMILLTGDALLNVAAVGFAGEGASVGWLEWAKYMAVPGFVASVLMMALHFLLFKQTGSLNINRETIIEEQRKLGPMTRNEKVTLIWVAVALILWATDFIHHIHPAWVAMAVVVGLALPKIGEILDPKDLSTGINWPIIVFVVGALAIGTVGKETGMSQWLAQVMLPDNPPSNAFAFAGLVGGATIIIHMLLGSALACMSIVSPPMVQYAIAAGWSPIFPALLVYTAVEIHYLFPFHHVTILLGEGETGGYSTAETIKYGIPLTIIALVVMVLVQVPWWRLVGLI